MILHSKGKKIPKWPMKTKTKTKAKAKTKKAPKIKSEDEVFHAMLKKAYGNKEWRQVQKIKAQVKKAEEEEVDNIWPSNHTYTGRIESVESVGYNGIDAVDVGLFFVDAPKYHDFHVLLTKEQARDERLSIGDQIKMTWVKYETVRRADQNEPFKVREAGMVPTLGGTL